MNKVVFEKATYLLTISIAIDEGANTFVSNTFVIAPSVRLT